MLGRSTTLIQRVPHRFQGNLVIPSRNFRSGKCHQITHNKKEQGFSGILQADNSTMTVKALHCTTMGAAVLTPLAFFLSPSPLNKPIDLALGILFPVHAHIGFNAIVSDYVPHRLRTMARYGVLGFTSVMVLGLLRLNCGVGMTESIKGLWRQPKKNETKESK